MGAIRNHPYVPCQHPGRHGYPESICETCREHPNRREHFSYACPVCDFHRARTSDDMAETISQHELTDVHRLGVQRQEAVEQARRHGHPEWSHLQAHGPCTRED